MSASTDVFLTGQTRERMIKTEILDALKLSFDWWKPCLIRSDANIADPS